MLTICLTVIDQRLTHQPGCRGVVLEAQGRFDEAVADYRTVLAAEPEDPSAWNNLGNASAGLQRWGDAAEFYGKAATLSPAFSFAAANKALATYQLGEKDPKNTDEALREMRCVDWFCYPMWCIMRALPCASHPSFSVLTC